MASQPSRHTRSAFVAFAAALAFVACLASGCRAQPPVQNQQSTPSTPSAIRTLKQFGAVGDGRADDTAAIGRALAQSDRYCLDGQGHSYRVSGTLRAARDLCLRNVTLVQAAVPVDTSAYITRRCPPVQDPSALVDCKDPTVPADQLARLWKSLSIRTLLIRSDDGRPLRVTLSHVKIDRGRYAEQGSRSDSAGIWLDGADGVDLDDVEITGNGKGYGLFISNARNVTLRNLWVHDLVWAPYRGDQPLSKAAVEAVGWNSVPIHEFREHRPGDTRAAKFYGVRIQEQLTCVALQNVSQVTVENLRIARCMARFQNGNLPWQADGFDLGNSSSDIKVNGAAIDSTWEGIDVVADGNGIQRLDMNDLKVTNAFSFGLKMGYQLHGASVSGLEVAGAGLAGVVLYGPVRDVRLSNLSIRDVGELRGPDGLYSPWPRGNHAGIRIDGTHGSTPEGIVIDHATASGRPGEFDFGLLNTGVDRVQLRDFTAQGFKSGEVRQPQ